MPFDTKEEQINKKGSKRSFHKGALHVITSLKANIWLVRKYFVCDHLTKFRVFPYNIPLLSIGSSSRNKS